MASHHHHHISRRASTLEDTTKLLEEKALSIVVIGASGDLAWKKTYPALFYLFCSGLLPAHAKIVGFARSPIDDHKFKSQISAAFPKDEDAKKDSFLSMCSYVAGQYNSASDFDRLGAACAELEVGALGANRLFYLAIPPSVFADVSRSIRASKTAMTSSGWNRVIIEKPFGRDSATFEELSQQLSACFSEDQLYRIDHYLGKEMVQNLNVVRFANGIFEPLWNRIHISNVQIVFKEDIGTEGRGGYFDQFGIIRDVMQNHLLQIFSLIAMEPPVSLAADDVRDEKVKVLRSTVPIKIEDVVIGQYLPNASGREPGYKDPASGVPADSVTPTFATALLYINNHRWAGVPFILKCGKALNERKAEIRIQFRTPPANYFGQVSPNELVLRVQPNEAVYWKVNAKEPGLTSTIRTTELDLTYKTRYKGFKNPDAYPRLIYEALKGDQGQFVRVDELAAAWKIFTPVLHHLEANRVEPIPYVFGSRGPAESDALIARAGFVHDSDYSWKAESR